MAVINVNEKIYQEMIESGKTVLLDFYADWCGHCKRVAPSVERFAEEYPDYAVGKINVDDEPELTEKFNVMSIPMLVVLKDGKVAAQNVGAMPYDLIVKMVTEA